MKGVDLSVEEGDFFALLGPNGAGKSTTIGIISGLVNKSAGQVKIFDQDLDINPADIEEAMNAANAIGDDRLQKQSQGYTVPESFTHGTSAQRKKWFMKGYQTGDIRQGDTFKTNDL